MIDKRWLAIVLGIALAFTGCNNGDNTVGVSVMKLPFVASLRAGESVQLPSQVSNVTFEMVTQDSRCPPGMECLWQGDAGVKLKLWQSVYSAEDCTLHTALNPRFVVLDGFQVSIWDLCPFSGNGTGTLPSEYVLTLQIDSLHTDQSGRD